MTNGANHPYFVALYETAKAINSSLELQDVLQEIVRNSAEALGTKAASLRLLDENGRSLVLCAAHGLSQDYLSKGPVLVECSDIDRQVLQGQPAKILDVTRDSRFQYPAEAAEEQIRSVLCVPLMLRDTGVGVLRVYSEQPRGYDDGEVDLLTAMASLGALAIRNARLHARVVDEFRKLEQYVTQSW